jgi:hypothetical protein
MSRAKPKVSELIQRVELLEEAIDRMLGAFKVDLAELREALRDLDAGSPTPPPRSPRPAPAPKRTISEEMRVGSKRDPRADD